MTPFAAFEGVGRTVRPTSAVVLGSGLGGAAAAFTPLVTLPFAAVPGLPTPTVAGHKGVLQVGHWPGDRPGLVYLGRVHFYEGHPAESVTRLVEVAADLGVTRLILTNAAGGIRADLDPGDLMAVTGHLWLLSPDAWKRPTADARPYTPGLVATAVAADSEVRTGVYAAVTGPAYETAAEIRAFAAMGADAVGMSTAREAVAGAARGLQVVAVSCVTNKAAGLAPGVLTHADVQATADKAVGRLARVVAGLVAAG